MVTSNVYLYWFIGRYCSRLDTTSEYRISLRQVCGWLQTIRYWRGRRHEYNTWNINQTITDEIASADVSFIEEESEEEEKEDDIVHRFFQWQMRLTMLTS